MNILDVGCGDKSATFLFGEKIVHVDIRRSAYHLEVLASIFTLPFLDNSFDIVHMSHLLEHFENPYDAIEELKRVSKRWVIVKVPNGVHYKLSYESPEHLFSWNESTFGHFLRRRFSYVKILSSKRVVDYERKSKLRTLKRLLFSIFRQKWELVAICRDYDESLVRTKEMILDVGCGSKAEHNYLEGNNIIHVDIDKTADADLFMDINHLGFKDKSFDVVHISHVLEHIIDPNIPIQEMKRVSRKTVIIKVPNATYFKFFNEGSDHIFSWNLTTFRNFLKQHFRHVKVYGNNHRVQEARNKFGKLKLFVLSLVLGDDELIAVCSVRKHK